MGSRQERREQFDEQFDGQLQDRNEELIAEQRMGISLAHDAFQDLGNGGGKINLTALILANRRHERAMTDVFWVNALIQNGLTRRFILKIFDAKDEISREINSSAETSEEQE